MIDSPVAVSVGQGCGRAWLVEVNVELTLVWLDRMELALASKLETPGGHMKKGFDSVHRPKCVSAYFKDQLFDNEAIPYGY